MGDHKILPGKRECASKGRLVRAKGGQRTY